MEMNRWQSLVGFPFDPNTITRNVPEKSGVYALFAFGVCAYVGESDDICASILERYHMDRTCLKEKHHLTHFTFELVPPETRAARQRELIRTFRPYCNLRTGGLDCRTCRLAREDDPAGVLSTEEAPPPLPHPMREGREHEGT